ncbi:Gfo/Idh/MocA family oxidoreductase [Marinospirillum sp. MEB164]|uniref:Gfo/Idh/MocA family oxidoreductase n=1 Tax=Marinospirillum alkalitolerans TaxID=3123374 RepID=A0ABW8PW08_9GAMM
MGKEKIKRALIVGLGSIGHRHLRLLREEMPSIDILVLRSSNCSQPLPYGAQCTQDIDDACAYKPQIAIIASPAPFHIKIAKKLAEHGVHLLIEKPISNSTQEIDTFLESCKERKVIVQTAYNLRFLNTLLHFKKEIDSRIIGKVYYIKYEVGQYLPSWRPGKDYRTTVSAQHKLGGGVLLELSHEIDILRWVFGEIDWVSCRSTKLSNLDIDVEDCAQLNIGFSNGALGNLSMDFLRHDTTRCCTAIGEYGTIKWDAVSGQVNLFTAKLNAWQIIKNESPDRDATYREQIKSFIKAIEDGKSSTTASSGYDGLAVLKIVEAAKESSSKNSQSISIEKS